MKKSNIRMGLACMLVLGLTTGYAAAQGSLTPTEAPAPTMKTLEQVEPRIDLATVAGNSSHQHIISQPGSYYLSGNLEVTTAFGIGIDAPGVTLDLNGFEISWVSGTYGVYIYSTGEGATVRNGSITGFSYGISANTEGCLFEKLSVSACFVYGIYATGPSSRIIDCRAFRNTGRGIYTYESSTLIGCTANNNQGSYGINAAAGSSLSGCTAYNNQGGTGIYAGAGSSLRGCTAIDNQGRGIDASSGSTLSDCTARSNQGDGIYVLYGSSLSGCTATDNQGRGFHVLDGSTLIGCTANNNQGDGIYAAAGSSLSGCTAYNNLGTYGINAAPGSSLIGCTAYNNESTASSSYGIYVSTRSTVIGCSAYNNSNTNSPGTSSQGVGIYAGNGSTVKDCTTSENEGDGIRIPGDCVVSGNTCDGNGKNGDGAGIHSTSTDNRIDGNNVTDTVRGIDVDTYGSLIIRNSASGNTTDYDIAADNDVGTIQTTPVGAGAWDNFRF